MSFIFIVGYNGGDAYSEQFSWAKFLKYKRYDPNVAKNNDGVCHSCRYSIEIRDDIFGANMRTFIWYGGTYPTGHVNAGQDWCFAFGESDWVGGRTWTDVRDDAIGNAFTIPPVAPIGRIDCLTGATLP